MAIVIDDSKESSDPLTWASPVARIIPEDFRLTDEYAMNHVTLEDLLSHRTGFPGHELSHGGPNSTIRDTVRSLRHLPMTAELREKFQYSNVMYAVAAHVIETVKGCWMGDFLRERIYEPLSMSSTYFSLDHAKKAVKHDGKHLATGYFWDKATETYIAEPWYDTDSISGSGGNISNVLDYAKYLRGMIEMAPFLSKEAHYALRTPRSFERPAGISSAPYTSPTDYCLGWGQKTYRNQVLYTHQGGLPGFGSLMAFVPGQHWGVAIMTNTDVTGNFAAMVLYFILLDNLLGTPKEERFDWVKLYDEQLKEGAKEIQKSKRTIYPIIASPPINFSLPLASYTGAYSHPGYRSMTLTIVKTPTTPNFTSHQKENLHAELMDRTWLCVVDFEHVSSEHFLAWFSPPPNAPNNVINEASPAEFRIKADGKVGEMGIALESEMKGSKIWFKKDE
jgi:CubicO group peptidase (beta-lactamase class C family)